MTDLMLLCKATNIGDVTIAIWNLVIQSSLFLSSIWFAFLGGLDSYHPHSLMRILIADDNSHKLTHYGAWRRIRLSDLIAMVVWKLLEIGKFSFYSLRMQTVLRKSMVK